MRTKVPVQGEGVMNGRKSKDVPPGYVDWEEHREAWEGYAIRYPGQDAETIAARGGFGYFELLTFLGHAPVTWRPANEEKYKDYVPPAEKPL